jgi:hypothetical protein
MAPIGMDWSAFTCNAAIFKSFCRFELAISSWHVYRLPIVQNPI